MHSLTLYTTALHLGELQLEVQVPAGLVYQDVRRFILEL